MGGCRDFREPTNPGNTPDEGPVIWDRTSAMADEPVGAVRADGAGSLYAGTDSGRLYRTFTDGETWIRLNLPHEEGAITAIVFNQAPSIFVASDARGVFYSSDAGSSWMSINAGLTDSSILSLISIAGTQLVAGSARGEIFSLSVPDTGWRLRFSVARPIVSLRSTTSGNCLAGTLHGGVFEFNASFTSIAQVNSGLPDLTVMTVYSLGSDWVYAGTRSSGLFRSIADRIFWREVGVNDLDRTINVLRIVPGGYLLAGTGTGVYLSDDTGDSWVRAGLDGLDVYALEVNSDGIFFAGTADGVYRGLFNDPDE